MWSLTNPCRVNWRKFISLNSWFERIIKTILLATLAENVNYMAKTKTTENDKNVSDFLKEIPDPERQNDAFAILDIMETVSGFRAKMWGPAIIGFGSFHYKYKSGHEGDSPLIGFSPRKNAFALYLSTGFANREKLLASFGKYKSS